MSFQLCIIKLLRTGSGSFSWLLRNSAAGMQQHQGDTWIKGSKGTELPEAADSTPTWEETTAASSSAPERPLTTGAAGLVTLEATADGAGCQKGREMEESSSARAALRCSLLISPTAALTPPLLTTVSCFSTGSLNPQLLSHQETPSFLSPLTTFLGPSAPAVSSHRCSTTTHTVLHNFQHNAPTLG